LEYNDIYKQGGAKMKNFFKMSNLKKYWPFAALGAIAAAAAAFFIGKKK
jgi:hypothetical protein